MKARRWSEARLSKIRATFWDRVSPEPNTGCWLWMGTVNRKGYGGSGYYKAHRRAWELANGSIPAGLCVCHRCDTPSCCNPAHLFLGTNAENNADRDRKGRGVALTGERHPNSRLTDEQVREIRALYVPRSVEFGTVALGRRFSARPGTIALIVTGKTRRSAGGNIRSAPRRRVPVEIRGESRSIVEWAQIVGVPYETIKTRLRYGWDIESAVFGKGEARS